MGESIPAMVHPLGRYWDQPPRENVLVDDKHALLTKADLEKLPRYEHSVPTGVYAGKMWASGRLLCWFGEAVDGMCLIHRRLILVVEEAPNHG